MNKRSNITLIALSLLTTTVFANENYCGNLQIGEIAAPPGAQSARITELDSRDTVKYPTTSGHPAENYLTSAGLAIADIAPIQIRHCFVRGEIKTDSGPGNKTVHFRMELPIENWNSKLFMIAQGGYAGIDNYGNFLGGMPAYKEGSDDSVNIGMRTPIERGYVQVTTDTGHKTSQGYVTQGWADKEPGLNSTAEVNWGDARGVHYTAVAAKAIIDHYYGQHPTYSYLYGCSNGGLTALKMAQRYPNDFDGVIAGAPNIDKAQNDFAIFGAVSKSLLETRGTLSQSQLLYMVNKVVENCDALDGLVDGVVTDPRLCTAAYYDPDIDLPKCADVAPGELCFRDNQLDHIRAIYQGPSTGLMVNNTGPLALSRAMPVTTEAFWYVFWRLLDQKGDMLFIDSILADFVFSDIPQFGNKSVQQEYLLSTSLEQMAQDYNIFDSGILSVPANLNDFKDKNGRVIIFHGWSDVNISAYSSIDWVSNLQALTGPSDDFLRLFMVPAAGHCGWVSSLANRPQFGAPTTYFDGIHAIEAWVEQGQAPVRLIARTPRADAANIKTRPLCPDPEIAVYKGSGDPNSAANFECQ